MLSGICKVIWMLCLDALLLLKHWVLVTCTYFRREGPPFLGRQEAKGSQGPSITQERDMEMARMPLLNIFRNPTCKYAAGVAGALGRR